MSRRPRTNRRPGETGQVLVLVAVMLPLLFIPVIGLAIDGGNVFGARRALQNAADAAARAGAMQVDARAYRESGGAVIVLDQADARRVAAEYLSAQRPALDALVRTDDRRVVVEASREVPTAFLRLVGLRSVRVAAVAPAEVRVGVERGEG